MHLFVSGGIELEVICPNSDKASELMYEGQLD